MLHLMKLAVGARDVADLRAWQDERARVEPPLRHRTRSAPRRAEEIVAGGSIYWIVSGAMLVRQRVLDVIEDRWDDGTACAGIVLDRTLVPVQARLVRPFQGWRYLQAADAPGDQRADDPSLPPLPEPLRRELRALCLI
jgi:hypothetical protein